MNSGFKSGFAAILGKPNVGKSSFINRIIGKKIAIVTSKPQTTRRRILGVLNGAGYQIVFVDTPGFYKPRHILGEYMLESAKEEAKEADIVIFMVDASTPPLPEDNHVAEFLASGSQKKIKRILLVNKIDRIEPEILAGRIEEYKALTNFEEIIPISCLTGENLEKAGDSVVKYLPEGFPFFPPEQTTDLDEKIQISEIIREKAMSLSRQEVPHGIMVEVEELKPGKKPGYIYISAYIYVEKESHKKIIVGKGGERLKQVGTLARKEIEEILEKKVYLELWVKVKPDWRDREDILKAWGFR
ncbi:MAG: GTPase Era [Firmicutes bacterium]|nr:GTPase Era [Bacillota bacterium]